MKFLKSSNNGLELHWLSAGFLTILLLIAPLSINGQNTNATTLYKVFAVTPWNPKTSEVGQTRQHYVDVKLVGNRFYWGDHTYYDVYNKTEKQIGFITYTNYEFIDKYKQRGEIILLYDPNDDPATQYTFFVSFEGDDNGMAYQSNPPKKL